jgi:hypothetical protein
MVGWKGIRAGRGSMIDVGAGILGLLSAGIFLAHALDAYSAK